jgi:hypothetical protein
VIYADGASLEFILAAEGALSIDGPYRVLLDRTGVVDRALVRQSRPPDLEPAREVVRRLIVWFWHDVEHIVTALGRRQTWWAYGQLDELRRVCLDLARLADGAEIATGESYWKIDEAIAAGHLERLEDSVAPLQAGPILDATLALVQSYRELAQGLATVHGIAYPAELDRLVSVELEQLAATGTDTSWRHNPGDRAARSNGRSAETRALHASAAPIVLRRMRRFPPRRRSASAREATSGSAAHSDRGTSIETGAAWRFDEAERMGTTGLALTCRELRVPQGEPDADARTLPIE